MLSMVGCDILPKLAGSTSGIAGNALTPLLEWFRDNFRCQPPVLPQDVDAEVPSRYRHPSSCL